MNNSLENFYKGRQTLITGATGFVGGHLARKLLQLGARVTLLVRSSSSASTVSELKEHGAVIVEGDLRDSEQVKRASAGVDTTFHVGAIFREAKFPDSVYFDINAGGTSNILNAAKQYGVRRVVHCSTNGVHGGLGVTPVSEDAPFRPSDVYQESKCEAERIVNSWVEAGGDASIIRPAMIWGEGDLRFRKMFRGIARRRLPIIGTGKTWTHWIYVHDLVTSFLLAGMMEKARGRAYLIAGREPQHLEVVYQTIAKLAGVNVLPVRIPALPLQIAGSCVEFICRPLGIEPPLHRRRVDFFVKNRIFDISRARNELGFEAAQDFSDEAERVYRWYKQQGLLT